MSSKLSRISNWFSRHRRTLLWLALVVVTGWLPLLAVGVLYWEFSDEVYPATGVYEAEPAEKLDDVLRGEGPPLVFAHRGDFLFHGKNSMQAFERAVRRGYDGIELDVINTAEDVPVVSHNFTLGGGEDALFVPEATVAEVRAYADGLPDEQGARFHTLGEVLERFGGETLFIVEIKAKEDTSFGVEPHVCEVIKAKGAADTVIVTSLKYHVVETLADTPACEGIARMYEVSGSGGDPPGDYDLPMLGLRHDLFVERKERYPDMVRAFSVYTPNRTFFIERAFEEGALIVQTDRPSRAMRIREEMFEY